MAARFLHIRVLLYRPLLVQLCRKINAQAKTVSEEKLRDTSRARNKLLGAFTEKCSIACIETAQALIDHINNGSETTSCGLPWYSCYCMAYLPVKVLVNLPR